MNRPDVVAHRGYSAVAPQNTLAAFEAACQIGADQLELDVRLTADGAVVVMHDAHVDSTTSGTGRIADMTLAEIRALDAGGWFAPAFAGQRVPTFDEVVALLGRHPDIDLLLELKGEWTQDQVRLVTEPLRAAGLGERTVGQSFRVSTVAALRDADPDLRRGLLVKERDPDLLARCADLGVIMCNPKDRLLVGDPGLVGRLHDAGLRTYVWTPNEPAHWAAALRLGVDGIVTDRAGRLRGWLDAQAFRSR